ncbi:MAG: ATP-binding protein [Candidatus Methylomirabilia bacterium]
MSEESQTDREPGQLAQRLARLAQSIGESHPTASGLGAVARAAADLCGFARVWIWRIHPGQTRLSTLVALGTAESSGATLAIPPGLLKTVCEDRAPRLRVEVNAQSLGVPLDLPTGGSNPGVLLPLLSGGELEGLLLGVWAVAESSSNEQRSTLLTLAAEAALLIRVDRLAEERERLGARYAALAGQLKVGVALVSTRLELLEANDHFRQMVGLAPDDSRRLGLAEWVGKLADRAKIGQFLTNALESGQEATLRGLRLHRSNGFAAPVALSAHPLLLGQAPTLQLILAEALDESRDGQADSLRLFGLHLAELANDLKGPVTAYLGHLKLLADRKDLPEDLREAFKLYRHVTAETLNRISRAMEWGRRLPITEPVDLRAVLEGAVATIEGSDLPDHVELVVAAEPVPPIAGMADQVQVAIEQLLRNACEALVDREGTIQAVVTAEGESVSVSISDSGDGIPESILPHVFDPFSSTKGAGEGRGLGLPIVKEITARHGGTVEVRSKAGEGTTVVLSFPRLTDAEGRAGSPLDRLTVLLVDDDIGLQESYRLMLERGGYRVVAAMDADEALRQIAGEAPDVLLIDVQMPGRDGLALIAALKKWHPEYLRRAVIHTAYAYEARVRDTAKQCGLTLLEKPCDPELLFGTLARLASPE